ncbi:unnamed protein product [Cylindrotheca closterium]|uniref:Cleavage and polyadenylation specificity factor subunit 4 n=1 Tax=Cylindrotheca closterium TaxID=2856 RepID=A0AAD2G5G5_9STRA|nr:unnamed protein product [Cylindrotheca closterium]
MAPSHYNDKEEDNNGGDHHQEGEEEPGFKIHISRVPTKFTEEIVERILSEKLGSDAISKVELILPREEDEEEKGEGGDHKLDDSPYKKDEGKTHRGFGFVTFKTQETQEAALKLEQIKGGRKPTSKKMHKIYLRPYAQNDKEMNLCYLWSQYRCPYGDECKFEHVGEGGTLPSSCHVIDDAARAKRKKGKCFAFKKGKCDKGDACPFSHENVVVKPTAVIVDDETAGNAAESKKEIPKSEKDCINWKTKGKCRKGDKCPYKHDPQLQKKALLKQAKKKKIALGSDDNNKTQKEKQPLSVRVFGLNYETTEQDIRKFFEGCGQIQDITFPIFEDSGRSKGYCGVWFSSPKAVAKAIELDGQELHGRWLRIQAGKMYLKQWEGNHPQQPAAKRARTIHHGGSHHQ